MTQTIEIWWDRGNGRMLRRDAKWIKSMQGCGGCIRNYWIVTPWGFIGV